MHQWNKPYLSAPQIPPIEVTNALSDLASSDEAQPENLRRRLREATREAEPQTCLAAQAAGLVHWPQL